MKYFLLIILIVITLVSPISAETPNYDDDNDYKNFIGRLYINDIGIDVALYESFLSSVVDRDDSAAHFRWSKYELIADHNTEAFAPLGTTKIGTIAHIAKKNGTFLYYECIAIFKGHNTGANITDWDGNKVTQEADLLMYTCFNGSKNIWVTLWNQTVSPEERERIKQQTNFITAVENQIEKMQETINNTPSITSTDEEEEIELVFVPN